MNTSYVYKAYNKVTKKFTELLEFTSPAPLLALVQLRFDTLSDVDRENAAFDFKALTDALNDSFIPASIQQSKKQFAVYSYKLCSQHYVYFVDVVIQPNLKNQRKEIAI